MLQQDTIASIRTYITDHFPTARKRRLGDSDPLLQSGVIDSMGILDLVAHIEATFGISVIDEDLVPENFGSIRVIAAFIETRQQKCVNS